MQAVWEEGAHTTALNLPAPRLATRVRVCPPLQVPCTEKPFPWRRSARRGETEHPMCPECLALRGRDCPPAPPNGKRCSGSRGRLTTIRLPASAAGIRRAITGPSIPSTPPASRRLRRRHQRQGCHRAQAGQTPPASVPEPYRSLAEERERRGTTSDLHDSTGRASPSAEPALIPSVPATPPSAPQRIRLPISGIPLLRPDFTSGTTVLAAGDRASALPLCCVAFPLPTETPDPGP